MLATYPSPMNNKILRKKLSNSNINVGSFHCVIVEYISVKAEI